MVLESPFYGARKPHYQFGSQLLRVSDLLTLGRSTIEESLCLLDWAGRHGYARLGQLRLTSFRQHTCMRVSWMGMFTVFPSNEQHHATSALAQKVSIDL